MLAYGKLAQIPTMRISAIIPCYNEEESIAAVIRSVPAGVDEIIVVDNNSTDRSAQIASGLGVRVVSEPSQGYGNALKAGFRAATGDVVATLDGDGQYPAELIMELASRLETEGLDFISGSRFPLRDPRSLSAVRVMGNRLFTFAANVLFGLKLSDSQSGMWVFRKAILGVISLESGDMPLSQEIKIRVACDPRFRFTECPIPYRPRTGSSKLIPVKHGLINLAALLKLRFTLRRTAS